MSLNCLTDQICNWIKPWFFFIQYGKIAAAAYHEDVTGLEDYFVRRIYNNIKGNYLIRLNHAVANETINFMDCHGIVCFPELKEGYLCFVRNDLMTFSL